jgi:hypothetical protein
MITVTLSEVRSEGLVRRIAKSADKEIWWNIRGMNEVLPPPLDLHDMAATSFVFDAMSLGDDLHIAGPVSRSLLENLEDFVGSWVNYCPNLYKTIKISADEEVFDETRISLPHTKGLAIAAFSGGLDATFTAWRHHNQRVGRKNKKLLAGVLIHGFDIPLNATDAFDISVASAATTLQSINLPLVTIQTNWKNEVSRNWEMEFGGGVATCLMNWLGSVDTALIASDLDYRRLVYPGGGSPMSYAMLSNDGFQVIYDGCAFARTQKAECISDWKMGLNNLRVCWEGPLTGKNCGTCEKCIRTKLNFLAVGLPLPPALPGAPTLFSIFRLRTTNDQQLALLSDILDMAKQRKIEGFWVRALQLAIYKNQLIQQFAILRLMQKYWWKSKCVIKAFNRVMTQQWLPSIKKSKTNA